jgi:hypothetical protein
MWILNIDFAEVVAHYILWEQRWDEDKICFMIGIGREKELIIFFRKDMGRDATKI